MAGDGGKWVCGLGFFLRRPHCLVYSLGSAGDTSFEEDILSKTSCEVKNVAITVVQGSKRYVRQCTV